jgi:lipopolysaccharide export system protein LptA
VELSKNVVVLQNEDRLEAKQFMFNRRTGKRTGKGDVKFRVRISSNSQGDSDTSSNKSE